MLKDMKSILDKTEPRKEYHTRILEKNDNEKYYHMIVSHYNINPDEVNSVLLIESCGFIVGMFTLNEDGTYNAHGNEDELNNPSEYGIDAGQCINRFTHWMQF